MSTGYSVDLGALQQAASRVNGTLDEISLQKVSAIPHDESAIGHGELADTLSDFPSRWQRGVDNLSKDAQEIATRLTDNVNAYDKVASEIHHGFTGMLHGDGSDPGVK